MSSLPTNTDASSRDWSSLPELAVFDIATRLNPIEFAALAGVCNPWRTICTKNKTQIHAHHPPLLLLLNFTREFHTRPSCKAYSFPDKRLYSKPLPPCLNVDDIRRYYGFSHGYILSATFHSNMEGGGSRVYGVYLFNPFTEDVISMPTVPARYEVFEAVLTAPPGTPDSVVVALSWDCIMTCRPGVDDRWAALPCNLQERNPFLYQYVLYRAVFFKDRLYVLLFDQVITIDIKPGISVKIIGSFRFIDPADTSHMIEGWNSHLCFVVGEDELFVHKLDEPRFLHNKKNWMSQLYRLEDRENGIWELVRDLGGRTLFATEFYFGFVPSGARLVGWEEGWEDSVLLFAPPFCSIQLDGTSRPFVLANKSGSYKCLFPFDHYNHMGWVPPSYFCLS